MVTALGTRRIGRTSRKRSRSSFLICSINILLHNAFWTNTTSALLHQERTCALLQRAVLLRKFAFEVTARASSSDDLGKTLETMTVKELLDFLKRSALNERGVISRLKLKKELVYLKENIDSNRLAKSSGNFSENVRTDALKRTSNRELRLPTYNKSGAILKIMRMPHGVQSLCDGGIDRAGFPTVSSA